MVEFARDVLEVYLRVDVQYGLKSVPAGYVFPRKLRNAGGIPEQFSTFMDKPAAYVCPPKFSNKSRQLSIAL